MPKLIGSAPNQVSVNGMLGDMAFQSSDAVTVAKLDVAGSIGNVQVASGGDQIAYTFNGYNYLTATGASATIQIQATGASGRLTFATAGSERMRITSAGDVGIGATNPQYKLDVAGTAANTISGVRDSTGYALFRSANSGNITFFGVDSSTGVGSGTANASMVWGNSSQPMVFGTNNAERMRIDTNGNIGIGTTSLGGNSVNRVVKAYGSTSASFQAQSSVTTITVGAGGAEGYVEVTGAYPLQLIVNGSERVRVASDGKVGIGTTGATALLDVNSDTVRVRTSRTPASATATGNAGDICWDANYVYVCTATNTWKRAALSTW